MGIDFRTRKMKLEVRETKTTSRNECEEGGLVMRPEEKPNFYLCN